MKATRLLFLPSFMLTLCLYIEVTGQCIAQGPNSPASASNDASTGVVGWLSTGNIFTSNNSRATVTAVVVADVSYRLVATGFNFSIPSDATICGITAEMEKSASGLFQNVTDNVVQLVKGGTIAGDNKAEGGTWPGADTYSSYGGPSDLWGTTWTPAEINAVDFGIAVAADLSGGGIVPTAMIDHVRVTVDYDIVLPIELVDLEGRRIDNTLVELVWHSSSENDNDYFTIERSADGLHWTEKGTVQGAGSSHVPTGYRFTDKNDLYVMSYYRLRQTDYDGTSRHSATVAIPPAGRSARAPVQVYPNPAKGLINIKTDEGISQVAIHDRAGGLIKSLRLDCTAPSTHVECPLPENSEGLYIVRITDCGGNVFYEKLVLE